MKKIIGWIILLGTMLGALLGVCVAVYYSVGLVPAILTLISLLIGIPAITLFLWAGIELIFGDENEQIKRK